jgi:hypothetical protein
MGSRVRKELFGLVQLQLACPAAGRKTIVGTTPVEAQLKSSGLVDFGREMRGLAERLSKLVSVNCDTYATIYRKLPAA